MQLIYIGNIYKNYINRYIKNNVAIAPPEQYNIMKSIYEQYLKRNSDYVYITKALVTNHILEQDTNTIFNLYFLYSNRENLYGNGNKVEEHIKNRILI
jgi:ribosomal protein S19E (S16A)